MPLPTNFTDQIIDETQNLDRKYIPTLNDDNTYSFTDVTVYTDSGSKFTANHMNATNTQVNINTNKIGTESLHTTSQNLCGAINEHQQDIDDINTELTDITDQISNSIETKYDEATGKPMWKDKGADTWNFFSSDLDINWVTLVTESVNPSANISCEIDDIFMITVNCASDGAHRQNVALTGCEVLNQQKVWCGGGSQVAQNNISTVKATNTTIKISVTGNVLSTILYTKL